MRYILGTDLTRRREEFCSISSSVIIQFSLSGSKPMDSLATEHLIQFKCLKKKDFLSMSLVTIQMCFPSVFPKSAAAAAK